jgi:hypothetical protein
MDNATEKHKFLMEMLEALRRDLPNEGIADVLLTGDDQYWINDVYESSYLAESFTTFAPAAI